MQHSACGGLSDAAFSPSGIVDSRWNTQTLSCESTAMPPTCPVTHLFGKACDHSGSGSKVGPGWRPDCAVADCWKSAAPPPMAIASATLAPPVHIVLVISHSFRIRCRAWIILREGLKDRCLPECNVVIRWPGVYHSYVSPFFKEHCMRVHVAAASTMILAASTVIAAQFDRDRVIPGGGILVQGWTGKIDASSVRQGRQLNDSKFVQEGNALHVTAGPATTFWNPANTASGDYTVKATFREPKFMELNSHPHSYGILIGGNKLGTDSMTLVYCVAYGDGQALVRGFGPAVFTLLGTSANAAVHKAPGVGQPVTQDIVWKVKGGRAECSINGTVVAGYDRAQLVGAGKLESTDGVYGLRFTHNVEAIVSGFAMTKG